MSTTDPILSATGVLWRAANFARAALHTMEGGDLYPLCNEFGEDRQRAADALADLLRLIRDETEAEASRLAELPGNCNT